MDTTFSLNGISEQDSMTARQVQMSEKWATSMAQKLDHVSLRKLSYENAIFYDKKVKKFTLPKAQ